MKLRSILFLGLVGGLALSACGGDDDEGGGSGGSGTGGSGTGGSGTGGSSSGGSAGSASGGSAGSASGGTAGTSTGGTAGSGTGGSAGSGTGGSAGSAADAGGDAKAPLSVDAFCASYETHCGFGTTDHYASSADCKTKYGAFSESRKQCATDHLAMADKTTSLHCTHAAGAAPCN